MGNKLVRLRRTADQMYPLMASYETSGQTQTEFCVDHEKKWGVFQYWLKKYRGENDTVKTTLFSNLEVVDFEDTANRIVIRTMSGVELEIPIR